MIIHLKQFDEVKQKHFYKVNNVVTSIVGSVNIRITERAFVEVWRRRSMFKTNTALVGYLYVYARESAVEHIRNQK